ncbi:MAG: serine hydrolase [Thermomicrobiales bacterium]
MTCGNLPDIASAMAALLQTPNVSVAWSVRLADGHELEHRADAPMEAGSTFKAVVAAECCRQVERGHLAWSDLFVIRLEDRVPASASTEQLPVGATIPLDDAVQVMVTDSDNTATDLVMGKVGHDAVVRLIDELGLREMRIPESVKELYAQPEDESIAAFTTSMRNLRTFHDMVFREELFIQPTTQQRYLAFPQGEDEQQGTSWPNGVTCYRKGGSLHSDAMVAQAIPGAFTRNGAVTTWAFAIKQRPSPLDGQPAMFDEIARGLGKALSGITDTLQR